MIRSVKGSATRQLIAGGKSKFRGLNVSLARQRLAELNAAASLSEISPLRSVGLHKLKGDRAGYWSISVNGPWRIICWFEDGNAYEVQIVDYH